MSAPRVLFITNSHAAMYEWQRGKLLAPAVFSADDAGHDAFEAYIQSDTRTVVSVVVDVIEEEFRNELVPHVAGRDHAILIRRRAEQAFRLTPYRMAVVQGRRPTGKREDEVLLSGLTNPDVMRTWLEILSENKVPINGMYSLAQLTGGLLQKLGVADKCALLITRQEFGGMRQAFFLNKSLKISRQSPVQGSDAAQYAESVVTEVDKARRYLTRLKLVDRDDVLHVHVVSDAASLDALRAACRDAPAIQFHFHALEQELRGVLRHDQGCAFTEPLYVRLLRKATPKTDYATAAERRYNNYRRARIGLHGLSAATLAIGVIWTGMNTINVQLMREYGSTANQLSGEMLERYERVLADIPKTPVTPHDLRIGVEIANNLIETRALPQPMIYALSRGLQGIGDVRVQSIDWEPAHDPNQVMLGRAPAEQANQEQEVQDSSGGGTAADASPSDRGMYHVALLRASIRSFDGDYKKAFATVERFVAALKRNADVTEAVAVDLPLNTRPTVSLQGKAGVREQDFTAEFSVRAVLKVKSRDAL